MDADGELAGGLYGVAIGGLFAGESMFHRRTDASKVALVALVERLRDVGAWPLLDVQWVTPHLAIARRAIERPATTSATCSALAVRCADDARRLTDRVGRRACRRESARWPTGPPVADADVLGALHRRASNALYRTNLAKGQTGLSIAFDLPTQTGLRPRRTRSPAARSARSACRSPTSATCARCSTASRSAR